MREHEGNIGVFPYDEKKVVEVELKTLKGVVETIEGSSKGPYWLGTEDPYEYLANYARVLRLKERILTRSLPALEIRLTEVQSISSTGTIEFPQAPDAEGSDEIKRKAREALIRRFEEDTAGVNLTPTEQKLVDFYKRELVENDFIPADKAMDYMWGSEVDRAKKANRLTVAHVYINRKIMERKWSISNKIPRGGIKNKGQFFFKFIEEQTSSEETYPPVETLNNRLSLEVDISKREVRVNGKDGVAKLKDNVDYGLFQFLWNNSEKGVTLHERKLRDLVAKEKKITIPHLQLLALVGSIDSINSTFNEAFKLDKENPLIVISQEGRIRIYKLDVKEVNFVKRERTPKIVEVLLSDGLVVRTEGGNEAKCLRHLNLVQGVVIPLNELSRFLHNGKDDENAIRSTLGVVNKLNKLLPADRQIQTENGICLPVKILPEIPDVEITPLAGPQEPTIISPERTDGDVILTEDELRSPVETRLLNLVIDELTNYGRLNWVRMHQQMSDTIRSENLRVKLGKRQIRPFYKNEVQFFVTSALDKLIRESRFDMLRSRWTEQDSKLWEVVQRVINQLGGDSEVLKVKLRREIARAEREFYKSNPSQSGSRVYWIDLD